MIFSIAPLFYNMGIILGVIFFYDKYGVYGLAYGVVLGAIAHLLVQSITIWKAKFNFKFMMDMSVIKEELSLAGPRSVSLLLQQSRIIVMNIFAGYFGVGVLSVFVFATTLAALPAQFFGVSFAVASFPKMSEMFELKDEDGFRGLAKKSIFNLTWISILVSILCIAFAQLIARLVYGDVAHIESVVVMFAVLCIAIPFQTVNWFATRVFYARRDSWSPLVAQVTAFSITVSSLYMCYISNIGAMSLVYATVIGCIAESVALLSLYIKKSQKML
jgi:putative peptidoglycan lipid II flippase